MLDDKIAIYKNIQKESWGLFTPIESFTTIPASNLVKFSKIQPGNSVLDVACGTGVVAITAARLGAHVSALDLSPVLIERARLNISVADVVIDLQEGDVETLPYLDHSFDVVLSQFGHMFAPRPDIAIKEMLRVLKPGGTIAFSTWPPHLFVGHLFDLVKKYSPSPVDVPRPSLWGDPDIVREHLKNHVFDLTFDTGIMQFPALSINHYCTSVETTIGPILKLVQDSKTDPTLLNQFRSELKSLVSKYYAGNHVHQHYLMSRAKKCT